MTKYVIVSNKNKNDTYTSVCLTLEQFNKKDKDWQSDGETLLVEVVTSLKRLDIYFRAIFVEYLINTINHNTYQELLEYFNVTSSCDALYIYDGSESLQEWFYVEKSNQKLPLKNSEIKVKLLSEKVSPFSKRKNFTKQLVNTVSWNSELNKIENKEEILAIYEKNNLSAIDYCIGFGIRQFVFVKKYNYYLFIDKPFYFEIDKINKQKSIKNKLNWLNSNQYRIITELLFSINLYNNPEMTSSEFLIILENKRKGQEEIV